MDYAFSPPTYDHTALDILLPKLHIGQIVKLQSFMGTTCLSILEKRKDFQADTNYELWEEQCPALVSPIEPFSRVFWAKGEMQFTCLRVDKNGGGMNHDRNVSYFSIAFIPARFLRKYGRESYEHLPQAEIDALEMFEHEELYL